MSAADDAAVPELQALLEERARRARLAPDAGGEGAVFWFAEFRIGEERCALPLGSLRACLPLRMVTPVPLSAPEVIGVLRFQGQTLAAFSLASLLGARGWREDPAILLVVELAPGHLVAVDCEQIPKANALPLELVEKARAGAGRGAVVSLTTPELDQIQLLDVARLLARRGAEGDDAR